MTQGALHFRRRKPVANQKISEGDYVLLCLDARRTYMLKVEAGKTFHTHKGYVKLDELIGKEFGVAFQSSLGIMFTALKPTLEDYIMKSSRKTQINYPKDIALIVMFSGIGPGRRVNNSACTLREAKRQSLHLRAARRIPEKRREKPETGKPDGFRGAEKRRRHRWI
jgi:hypothetical protein